MWCKWQNRTFHKFCLPVFSLSLLNVLFHRRWVGVSQMAQPKISECKKSTDYRAPSFVVRFQYPQCCVPVTIDNLDAILYGIQKVCTYYYCNIMCHWTLVVYNFDQGFLLAYVHDMLNFQGLPIHKNFSMPQSLAAHTMCTNRCFSWISFAIMFFYR